MGILHFSSLPNIWGTPKVAMVLWYMRKRKIVIFVLQIQFWKNAQVLFRIYCNFD